MGFDRVAGVYRLLERIVFQGALQRAREAHLESLSLDDSARVLILGDGDGRFLEELMCRRPDLRVDVIDASSAMIDLAKRRLPEAHRMKVKFECRDVFDFVADSKGYDLVVSHFFLDCFKEAEIGRLVEIIGRWLKPSGEWLISDFQVPETGFFKRLRARVLLRLMYGFFRVTASLPAASLVDADPILLRSGFVLAGRKLSNAAFLRADRWCRKNS